MASKITSMTRRSHLWCFQHVTTEGAPLPLKLYLTGRHLMYGTNFVMFARGRRGYWMMRLFSWPSSCCHLILTLQPSGTTGERFLSIWKLWSESLAIFPYFLKREFMLGSSMNIMHLVSASTRNEDEMQKVYEAELSFLESCLKMNPKSYGSWHHRCWVSTRLPRPDWARELSLCDRCLSLDDRNCE